jgi:hypothetical protein
MTDNPPQFMSLDDIPPYTGSVKYEVDVSGGYLKKFIADHAHDYGLNLDPDFQRGHVWTQENQTRYLEHLLRGGSTSRTIIWNCPSYDPSPEFPASADAPSEMVIVDGKQRLTAVLRFLDDGVPVFGGRFLSNFDEQSRRQILGASGRLRLHMAVHALQHRHELLQLYIELNEGAIAHTPEEIARVKALRIAALADAGISND